jgi:hypothetical protein
MSNIYYTYAYLRKDGTPYYIGKGKKTRAYDKTHCVKVPSDKKRILILKKNLTEKEAYKHERYMIAVLGRKDNGTGILRNVTNGGEGNDYWLGKKRSPEDCLKMRMAQLGKKLPEETKLKIKNALLTSPKKRRKPITLQNITTLEVKTFISQSEAARAIGDWQSNIYKLEKGVISTVKGWRLYARSLQVSEQ